MLYVQGSDEELTIEASQNDDVSNGKKMNSVKSKCKGRCHIRGYETTSSVTRKRQKCLQTNHGEVLHLSTWSPASI